MDIFAIKVLIFCLLIKEIMTCLHFIPNNAHALFMHHKENFLSLLVCTSGIDVYFCVILVRSCGERKLYISTCLMKGKIGCYGNSRLNRK